MAVYSYADERARKLAAGDPLNYGKKPVVGMSANQAKTGTTGAVVGAIPKDLSTTNKTTTGAGTMGMSASQAGVGTTNAATQGSIPPIVNAATNKTGENPSLGYGGASYGASKDSNSAISANQGLIGTDAGKASEIKRTQDVIAARKAAGLDTSGQEKYLTVNLGYTPVNDVTTFAEPVVAPPDQYVSPVDLYPQLTPEQIQEEADARAAAALQARTTAADQAKTGINTSYDRMYQNIGEDRALENNFNDRQLSPFSGRSDFALGMIEQQRGRTDRENQQDLQTRLANIDVSLQDFANATEDQRQAMINEITRQERDYGLQVDAQKYGQWSDGRNFDYGKYQDMVNWTGNVPSGGYGGMQSLSAQGVAQGAAQPTMRTLAGQQFDYSKTRDAVADTQWAQTFEEDKRRYGEEFAYQKARDKIADANDKRDFDEQVRQNGVSAAVSWYNAKTSRAQETRLSSGGSGGGSSGGGSDGGNTKMPAKESADNSAAIRSEIINEKLTRADALKYLQANSDVLSDSDYNKLMTYINSIK